MPAFDSGGVAFVLNLENALEEITHHPVLSAPLGLTGQNIE